MKITKFLFLISLLTLFNACNLNYSSLKKANKSLDNLIPDKSEWSNYSQYVLEQRKKAMLQFQLNGDFWSSVEDFVILEEFLPQSDLSIVSELYFFNKQRNIKYESVNGKIRNTNTSISGRAKIIEFINEKNIQGLIKHAELHSATISDNSYIFITIVRKEIASSYLINQFEVQ